MGQSRLSSFYVREMQRENEAGRIMLKLIFFLGGITLVFFEEVSAGHILPMSCLRQPWTKAYSIKLIRPLGWEITRLQEQTLHRPDFYWPPTHSAVKMQKDLRVVALQRLTTFFKISFHFQSTDYTLTLLDRDGGSLTNHSAVGSGLQQLKI